MRKVQFRINRPVAGVEILADNQKLQRIAYEAMQGMLPVVEAQFFQEFGVEGSFEVAEFVTDRYTTKIAAADATTGAILRAHPGWLGQFTQDMKI